MMSLRDRQNEMRERFTALREQRRAVARQSREARERLEAEHDLPKTVSTSCIFCRHNKTVLVTRTGAIKPCSSCAAIARRLKAGEYDMTLHDFHRFLEQQKNRCAICAREFVHSVRHPRRPCIDHCHELNHVRGLLCHACNCAIGLLGEDELTVESALKYIRNNRIRRKWWSALENGAIHSS